ncbi:hypothetical protein CVT25_001603 [Psilocybe cyanescens]|uniref:Protein kinase domain-containing protein n=1 Tax=Psilocybe cyanescens TaxID=93625 RepID=A0A409WPZ4_PSICY|nr:hypothetical protein CVT25_001603 [Psilocybe cyanescens]
MFIYLTAGLLSLATILYVPKQIRIVKLDSPLESLLWTIRVLRWKRKFPGSCDDMIWKSDPSREQYLQTMYTWEFLAPFFASRGYRMHTKSPRSDDLFPEPVPPHPEQNTYPFARFIPSHDISFGWYSPSLWAARDNQGRDVVIKLISDVSRPSDEFLIMQRLNNKELRADPHNHTIPVLEWDGAFTADFGTVAELMEITKAFLENTGMNVICGFIALISAKGLRNPSEVRYALLDFGASQMFPCDTVIEDMTSTRRLNYRLRGLPVVKGSHNPFKSDVAFLGSGLQTRIRHIENVVPELGPFFDQMVIMTDEKQLTASQALSRFLEIYSSLSPEQLQALVIATHWRKDKLIYKPAYNPVPQE